MREPLSPGMCLALSFCLPCLGETLVVDPGGRGEFTAIQPALDAARDGDTVLVKPGIYVVREPIDFNRLHEDWDPRDPDKNVRGKNIRLLSVSGPEETILRMSETPRDPNRASVVRFANGETAESVLDGFTITGGRGMGETASSHFGGGIFCRGFSSPTIRNSIVALNAVDGQGGGIYCLNGCSPAISDTRIAMNYAGHSDRGFAGGIFCQADSSPTLDRCEILRNIAEGPAGGVWCWHRCRARFRGCTIMGNYAGRGGGGVDVYRSTPVFENCIIAGNSSATVGGGLYFATSSPVLINCTIAGNSAPEGGGLECFASVPVVKNCIVWGNAAPGVCGEFSHSVIDEDPLFLHPGAFRFDRFIAVSIGTEEYAFPDFVAAMPNYYLRPDSPCIEAGTAEGAPGGDLLGRPRPYGAGVDIGAYEFTGLAFRRGDTNADGRCDVADMVFCVRHVFGEALFPTCEKAADVNDDGQVDVADPIFGLNYLFAGGTRLPEPSAICGPDPTTDDLGCESFPPCGR